MTIVLPIVFFAVCLGLFARRITAVHWGLLAFWITLVIAYHFLKPIAAPLAAPMPQ